MQAPAYKTISPHPPNTIFLPASPLLHLHLSLSLSPSSSLPLSISIFISLSISIFISLSNSIFISLSNSIFISLSNSIDLSPPIIQSYLYNSIYKMARDSRAVNPNCPNASNPFHICAEYCPHGSPPSKTTINKQAPVLNGADYKEKGEKVKTSVDPSCVNASNPFHQCADYCSKRSSHDGKSPLQGVKKIGTKEMVVAVDNRKVNPSCPNASNPFHQCGEYCSQRSAIQKKQGSSVVTPGSNRGRANLVERKNVNRDCVNASNPFHKCSEYCSQTRRINGVV